MRQNLMQTRIAAGHTQEQTAAAINKTTRHYQALEAGTSNGSIKVWKKLSNLFNKPIDYLLEQAVDSPNLTDKG